MNNCFLIKSKSSYFEKMIGFGIDTENQVFVGKENSDV